MRAVIQRVQSASVTIDGTVKSSIGQGLLILLGIGHEDGSEDIDWLVKKVAGLRIFDDEEGVMNRSVMDVEGECLVVSQFTLFVAIPLYERFCAELSMATGRTVGTGSFGADMKVALLNDGPVTIIIDTKNKQ